MVEEQERRIHPRYRIDWPISLSQRRRGRLYSGRGHNLSQGGALVALPMSIPLKPGQELEMKLHPRVKSESVHTSEQPKEVRKAQVVRVERASSFLDGLQLVGLKFEDES